MINVAIVGYGNLGKGVLTALRKTNDMNLVGIFTRRQPELIENQTGEKAYSVEKLTEFKKSIDVLILCGGSATDLPTYTKEYLKDFNTVDSFDTHAKIPEYYQTLKEVAEKSNTLGAISIGWDPGVFSIARALFGAVLPDGNDYTFWGKGVSQGHSDALRRIDGVENAIQYTVPKEEALSLVRSGVRPDLSVREKHLRECYVAIKDGADANRIENEIKNMPNYFKDYDTVVNFVTAEEVKAMQSKLNHGGFVLRSGNTSEQNADLLELKLTLDSNPEFTGSVLVAYARAVYRMAKAGSKGVVTVLDVPISLLSEKTPEQLRETLL